MLFSESEDAFKQFILVSLILHFCLVIAASVKNLLSPQHVIEIPHSIRVDMVALPDKLPENIQPVPPQEKPPVALPPKPEQKKESLKEVKESQKKAFEKLQALSALEKIKKEVNAKASPPIEKAAAPQYKGNIISSGSSFTGLSRLRVNEYLEVLTGRVRDHWVLPQWLSGANLKASIVISIDSRGLITRKEVHTSSGNSIFDSSCLTAVTDASPFQPPPSEVKDALIMIRFPFE